MALRMGSLDDALRESGASEERAKAAAEEVTDFHQRMNTIERQLTSIKGELSGIRRVLGVHFAATTAILIRVWWP
jgi:hypothetical protein